MRSPNDARGQIRAGYKTHTYTMELSKFQAERVHVKAPNKKAQTTCCIIAGDTRTVHH